MREPGRAQAGSHNAADREHAAYRAYLVERLAPAVASSSFVEFDPVTEGEPWMTDDFIEQSL